MKSWLVTLTIHDLTSVDPAYKDGMVYNMYIVRIEVPINITILFIIIYYIDREWSLFLKNLLKYVKKFIRKVF